MTQQALHELRFHTEGDYEGGYSVPLRISRRQKLIEWLKKQKALWWG